MYKLLSNKYAFYIQILLDQDYWKTTPVRRLVTEAKSSKRTPPPLVDKALFLSIRNILPKVPEEVKPELLVTAAGGRGEMMRASHLRKFADKIENVLAEKLVKSYCDAIINSYQPLLLRTKQRLEQDALLMKNAASKLYAFLDIPQPAHKVTLCLLLPHPQGFGAWAWGNDRIVLMSPKGNSWGNVRRVILHEYGHTAFRRDMPASRGWLVYFRSLLRSERKVAKRLSVIADLPEEIAVEDLFLSSLVPEGEFGRMVFPHSTWVTELSADRFEKLRSAIATRMTALVRGRWEHKLSLTQYQDAFSGNLRNLLDKKSPVAIPGIF